MASLADLMDRNFDLRRSIFGDNALGATNLHMIRLARSVGGERGNITRYVAFYPFVLLLLLLFCGMDFSNHGQLLLAPDPPSPQE